MLNLDRFEDLHLKTPWAPKQLIERAQKGVLDLQSLLQNKKLKTEFFSSETEAFTQFLFSIVQEKALVEGRNHILFADHLRGPFKAILKQFEAFGIVLQNLPLNENGLLDPHLVKTFLYPTTMLVVLEPIDLSTGVCQPVEAIKEAIGEGVHLHLITKGECSFSKGWDLLADSLQIDQAQFVASDFGLKGSSDPELISAFSSTLHEKLQNSMEKGMHLSYLRRFFERNLESMGAKIYFKEQRREPGTLVFGFSDVHAELLAYYLHLKGVFVSIGGGARPLLQQHLTRMGHEDYEAAMAVHVRLNERIQEADLVNVLDVIQETLQMFKAGSKRG
ncbi:MAG: aminotransferase class V-fold PLP-dependent enzyme [Chlamydiae bacterium]|nr:aminotransferase class V-fold PLP-dependent enzyme [Chlamydiota bacterium]